MIQILFITAWSVAFHVMRACLSKTIHKKQEAVAVTWHGLDKWSFDIMSVATFLICDTAFDGSGSFDLGRNLWFSVESRSHGTWNHDNFLYKIISLRVWENGTFHAYNKFQYMYLKSC